MKSLSLRRLRALAVVLSPFALLGHAFAGSITLSSPQPGAAVSGAVPIVAAANEAQSFHLEVWDNGGKLGDVFSSSVNANTPMPKGPHVMTVLAVSDQGEVLDQTSVTYSVADGSGPGGVNISSPQPGATSIPAVRITASANQGNLNDLQIWDNGFKLGDVPAGSVNDVYVLPNGPHALTIQAMDASGNILGKSTVNYTVATNCSNSQSSQCDMDQIGTDNSQNNCQPSAETAWVANPCGAGVQGVNPVNPQSTRVEPVYEGQNPADLGNRSLDGHSLHLQEVQGGSPSNVLFRGDSPTSTPGHSVDSQWTLDQYVYLPDPSAHQAFEMDAQYTANGVWTKFYTECAFNMHSGTGYWAVFDTSTGGWIFLNGQNQGGQTPPVVPCNRSQFSQPWPGSANPSFSGWHHIAWSFQRNQDGTVTFKNLIFDGTTTAVNFRPNSGTGGGVSDEGNFSALIQLDGVVNHDGQHNVVDAYVDEVSLTHSH